MTVAIAVDDKEILATLDRLASRGGNLSKPLHDIGEHLKETTLRRFSASTGPDGKRWAPNSEATILNYLRLKGGSFTKKKGKLSARGAARVMNKRPLIGDGESLSTTINFEVGDNYVKVGSPETYAAMQQFGGKKSEFPNLWGDIPARPFLGLSADDRVAVLDILAGYLDPGQIGR